MEKILINYLGKKIKIEVKKTGFFRKGLGLMFRTKNTDNLIFDLKRPTHQRRAITSLFVFFNFLAVWLDDENSVIEWRVCNPFELKITPKNNFSRIVEIPLNKKNQKIIRFFVGKKWKGLNISSC